MMASSAPDDAQSARISSDCPLPAREILLAAWIHDLTTLKTLLDGPGKANCKDPLTGETPVHAAIRSDRDSEAAEEVVRELFMSGAIWNDVDSNDETPGCVAARLGRETLYNLCVEAGARAELLFALMEGYEELSSGPEDDTEMIDEEPTVDDAVNTANGEVEPVQELESTVPEGQSASSQPVAADVNSEEYLRSNLTYTSDKLIDDSGNGVMMAWETDIMARSVAALIPGSTSGKRVLNIGFGMGIIDSLLAATKPSRHHVVEAHPDVLARINAPDSTTTSFWHDLKASAEPGAFVVHAGKWQDICPQLLLAGETYDAIYFDTFGEDYSQLKFFFTEYVPGLLDQDGVFSFFNGLGADRQVCYDVYTKVVEMHLADAGLDVEWQNVDVALDGLEEAGKGEWEGVKRRYWTLKSKLNLLGLSMHFSALDIRLTQCSISIARLHLLRIITSWRMGQVVSSPTCHRIKPRPTS
jgi:type IV protein arginine methyltransferase